MSVRLGGGEGAKRRSRVLGAAGARTLSVAGIRLADLGRLTLGLVLALCSSPQSSAGARIAGESESVSAVASPRAAAPRTASTTAGLIGSSRVVGAVQTRRFARATSGDEVPAYVLVGTVTMTNSRGRASRLGKPEQALLFFEPDEPLSRSQERPRTHEMKTIGKQYEPRLLVVQRGDRVEFPNLDPILHNVFSVSGENRFDLEVYGEGESRGHVFEHTGLVRVFCNVHREMFAHIWVADTPHITRPAPDGSFRLRNLPPGPGTLTVWHERSDPRQLRVDPATADPLRLEVAMTRPRLPLHKNKYGKPYRRPTEY